MIQNVIRDMGGIAVYGIVSVCLFFIVFTGAIVWALLQRKSLCEKMRALPLEDGTGESSAESHRHASCRADGAPAPVEFKPFEVPALHKEARAGKRDCCGCCKAKGNSHE